MSNKEKISFSLSRKLAICHQAILDKHGFDINIIDLRGSSNIADFFMLVSARSTTQVKTIVDEIEIKLAQINETGYNVEGHLVNRWVLIDTGDLVIHIFLETAREYYRLDQHWSDARSYLVNG